MHFILPAFLLLLGFVLLVKGADFLIEGASGLAHRLRIPPLIVGLTVLAFGTSLPELVVNIFASLNGQSGITIGNVLGSNIANIGLILGVTGMFYALPVQRGLSRKELPFMLLTALVLLVLVADFWTNRAILNMLSGSDALILLLLFVIFLYILVAFNSKAVSKMDTPTVPHPLWILLTSLLFGLVGISFGGDLITTNASTIASYLGLSEVLIGLTIVSLGTSLPELATSLTAARRGQPDLAVGNVVGSNIFNTLLVLGVSASLHPIQFLTSNLIDLLVMLAFFFALFFIILARQKITRLHALLLLGAYLFYFIYVVYRG